MMVQIDEEKLRLLNEALSQVDELVTLVIQGDGSSTRCALKVARTLDDLKRFNAVAKKVRLRPVHH